MFTTDRWSSKILDLPVFDAPFAQAIKKTPLHSVAFVSAMEAVSSSDFVERVYGLGRSWDDSIVEVFHGRELMLEQFWTLSMSIKKAYFESTALQLGFGLCELAGSSSSSSTDPSATLRKRSAIANLTAQPMVQPKRAKTATQDSSSSSTPLRRGPRQSDGQLA